MSTTLSAIRMREMGIISEEMRAIQTITTMLTLLVSRPQGEARRPSLIGARCGVSVSRAIGRSSSSKRRVTRPRPRCARSCARCVCGHGAASRAISIVIDSEQSSYQMPLKRELSANLANNICATFRRGAVRTASRATDDVTPTERTALVGAAAPAAFR